MKVVFTSATAEFLYLWNTYMKYISQFPTWALFNPSKGLVIPKRGSFVPLKGYFFPKWGSWSLISFFRSTGVITLNIASSSFRCSRVYRFKTWKHLSKLFIRPDWHILRKLWHTKKVGLKKFIIKVRKHLVYSPKSLHSESLLRLSHHVSLRSH